MIEYATFATRWLHRHMADHVRQQRDRHWQAHMLTPAGERRIGLPGLGQLGGAMAQHLAQYGFQVSSWARTPREMAGVTTYAGKAALDDFLGRCDILICALPLTIETRGVLDRALFERLPSGAALINMGRGDHLVEANLTAALETGRLSGAVLDVLREEPPASGHPFRQDPRILMTPHVAAMTQPFRCF
ncbi:NAD(P)-dependent oxidoreductase [uncultured Kushneria sp.]|uniref:NAD(P)-dependent oxidoreductase n=1 Tax=uncultured Kushneria sp. TaxID=905033 RepID=UPI00262B1E98|nr:NAD(P)-dependent oxidoreductase [uncultured Kushneria sp.]